MSSFNMPRDFYIPKGATKIADKLSDAVAYIHTSPKGNPGAIMFHGKANKPDKNFLYRSSEARDSAVAKFFDACQQSRARKSERREKRKASGRGVEVGDILRNSWGYDQTNIDYFEVTALVGATMVEIREIGCESIGTAWMQGNSVPVPGKYIGPPMRKVAKDGAVKIHDWGSWARVMTPTVVAGVKVYSPSHWTAYA